MGMPGSGLGARVGHDPGGGQRGRHDPTSQGPVLHAAILARVRRLPGTVLRWREVVLSEVSNLATRAAYQILYRTTDAAGDPIAAMTTLLVPSDRGPGPTKLLSYQSAEDSLTTACAPSYTMRGGNGGGTTQYLESGLISLGLSHGWDVVVPDYEGPESEWAVGPLEGRATLDSIKAVESFAPAHLEGSATPVGLMGYSGGSIPTLWANALARTYAPKLHLVGAASGGNVPNLIENLGAANGSLLAGAIFGVVVAVNRAYPMLDLNAIPECTGHGPGGHRRCGR